MSKSVPISDWCSAVAAHADTFFYFQSFVPFRLRLVRGKRGQDPSKWQLARSKPGLPGLESFLESLGVADAFGNEADAAKQAYELLEKLGAKDRSASAAGAEIVDIINDVLEVYPLLLAKDVIKEVKVAERAFETFDDIGIMFFERIRFRSAGHTVESAPFQSIWLGPGSRRTLRERALAKRLVTLERTSEETADFRTEFSSTFATELMTEFASTFSVTNQSGANLGVSGEILGVGLNLGGNTSNAVTSTAGMTESRRRTRQVTRKVETAKHTSHKIVCSSSDEHVRESDDSHLLINERPYGIYYLLRRVLQVFHCSQERHGAALCWSRVINGVSQLLRDRVRDELAVAARENTHVLTSRWSLALYNVPWSIDVPSGLVPDLSSCRTTTDVTVSAPPRIWNVKWDSAAKRVTGSLEIPDAHLWNPVRYQVSMNAVLEGTPDPDSLASIRERMRAISGTARFNLLLRDVVLDALFRGLGLGAALGAASVQAVLRRLFALENLAIEVLPSLGIGTFDLEVSPEWGIESLRVMLPIRREAHAEALAFLVAFANVGPETLNLEQLMLLVQQGNSIIDRFIGSRSFDESDQKEIDRPNGIELTERTGDAWVNEFERQEPFDVIDRFVMTLPSDGIHATVVRSPACDVADAPVALPTEQ